MIKEDNSYYKKIPMGNRPPHTISEEDRERFISAFSQKHLSVEDKYKNMDFDRHEINSLKRFYHHSNFLTHTYRDDSRDYNVSITYDGNKSVFDVTRFYRRWSEWSTGENVYIDKIRIFKAPDEWYYVHISHNDRSISDNDKQLLYKCDQFSGLNELLSDIFNDMR